MMAAIAQLNMHIEIESAASAQEQGRALRPEPRAVGGDQYVGLEPVAVLLTHLAQAGGAHLLAGLDQVDNVKAESAAGLERRVDHNPLPDPLTPAWRSGQAAQRTGRSVIRPALSPQISRECKSARGCTENRRAPSSPRPMRRLPGRSRSSVWP